MAIELDLRVFCHFSVRGTFGAFRRLLHITGRTAVLTRISIEIERCFVTRLPGCEAAYRQLKGFIPGTLHLFSGDPTLKNGFNKIKRKPRANIGQKFGGSCKGY